MEEAKQWLLAHPGDQWRLRRSVKRRWETDPMRSMHVRVCEDDMGEFFVGQNPWEVDEASITRWRAAVEALLQITDS